MYETNLLTEEKSRRNVLLWWAPSCKLGILYYCMWFGTHELQYSIDIYLTRMHPTSPGPTMQVNQQGCTSDTTQHTAAGPGPTMQVYQQGCTSRHYSAHLVDWLTTASKVSNCFIQSNIFVHRRVVQLILHISLLSYSLTNQYTWSLISRDWKIV
jgi:hypothetical protein